MAAHNPEVISVIDDDASVRRALRNLLSSAGYQVETFASAEAFLQSDHRENAGCLILDLGLPGMSGLDLMKCLNALCSKARIIVLTAQGNDEVRRKFLRAGAVAFFKKPVESAELLDAVRRCQEMRAGDRSIPLASGTLGRHRHICAFFNDADEEHSVLHSFIQDGLDGGEKGFHIVDPDLRDAYLKRLADSDIDVEGTMASGQLEVVPWEEAHLREGRFEQDAMLAMVEEMLQSNAAAGYPLTRIVAHMEWALLDRPGVDDLIEYEARVNYVLPKYADPAICVYDLSKFSADVAMDILRTHPMVILDGALQENPSYVPPDQFLLEIQERRSAREGRPPK